MANTSEKQHKSRSYRLAWWSFIFSIFFIFLGIVNEVQVGSFHLKFKMIDSSVVLFLLSSSFGLYGVRRYTEAKFQPKDQSPD